MAHCTSCGAATRTQDPARRHCDACGHTDYTNPAPAVSAIIVRDAQILLSKRKNSPHQGDWDLPGGFVEAGESGPEALAREIKEETGMRLVDAEIVAIAPGQYDGRPTFNVIYEATAQGEPVADDDSDELTWFDLRERPRICWRHEEEAVQAVAARTAPTPDI